MSDHNKIRQELVFLRLADVSGQRTGGLQRAGLFPRIQVPFDRHVHHAVNIHSQSLVFSASFNKDAAVSDSEKALIELKLGPQTEKLAAVDQTPYTVG